MSPIRPENRHRYPKNWKDIRQRILARAALSCEFCGATQYGPHPRTGKRVVLTIAHLDHTPENNAPENLRALCQPCHLTYDAKEHASNRRKNIARESGQVEMLLTETP